MTAADGGRVSCPDWCAGESEHITGLIHHSPPAYAGERSVFVQLRERGYGPTVRMYTSSPEHGADLTPNTARTIAAALENLPKAADRRVIAQALRDTAAQMEALRGEAEAGS